MDIPKVSVIVPAYNVEKYIDKCLYSLVNQTLKELEIIVVNDGSPDNSELIIKNYCAKYPNKIRYLKKANGGLSDARNYGIKYATGEYLAFVDADDYVELNSYEEMYNTSNNGMKKIIECDFLFEWSKKNSVDETGNYEDIKDYLIRGRVVAWNKIYKREWLENTKVVFPKGLLYEDVSFFFSIVPTLSDIEEVGKVNKPLIHYVQRKGSISQTEIRRAVEICNEYKIAINYLKENNLFELYRDEIEYRFVKQALLRFTITKVLKEKNKKCRKKLLGIMWNSVNEEFPNWKNNKYLKTVNINNIYLKVLFKYVYLSL